jgi:hypothetical protein
MHSPDSCPEEALSTQEDSMGGRHLLADDLVEEIDDAPNVGSSQKDDLCAL